MLLILCISALPTLTRAQNHQPVAEVVQQTTTNAVADDAQEIENLLILLESPIDKGGYGISDIRTIVAEPTFRTFVDSSAWASNIFYNDRFALYAQVVAAYKKSCAPSAPSGKPWDRDWKSVATSGSTLDAHPARRPYSEILDPAPQPAPTAQQELIAKQVFGRSFNQVAAAGVIPQVWMAQTRDSYRLKEIKAYKEKVERFYTAKSAPAAAPAAPRSSAAYSGVFDPLDSGGSSFNDSYNLDAEYKLRQLERSVRELQNR